MTDCCGKHYIVSVLAEKMSNSANGEPVEGALEILSLLTDGVDQAFLFLMGLMVAVESPMIAQAFYGALGIDPNSKPLFEGREQFVTACEKVGITAPSQPLAEDDVKAAVNEVARHLEAN